MQSMDYDTRLAALLARGFGLWDVVADAEREGSLDADIRNARAHDLRTLAGDLPVLSTIAFNGGTAARIGIKQLGFAGDRFKLLRLPSSSPAHAVPFQDKLQRWCALAPGKATNDNAEQPSVT